jgi:hypothetical protein
MLPLVDNAIGKAIRRAEELRRRKTDAPPFEGRGIQASIFQSRSATNAGHHGNGK